MDKHNILVPFAYNVSAESEKIPLNTTPRDRKTIDENARSIYHTRGSNAMRKNAIFKEVPRLKRKGGESFNERDDIKRRETGVNPSSSDVNPQDENSQSEKDIEDDDQLQVYNPPSSPYTGQLLHSDIVLDEIYEVPDSPNIEEMKPETLEKKFLGEFNDNSKHSKSQYGIKHISSDADFGIDSFNRFQGTRNSCSLTDEDSQFDLLSSFEKENLAQSLARQRILEAFEDVRTTINLEGMGLHKIPEEIGDFNDLVIFNSDPSRMQLFQLYLTDNNISQLNLSLFKFTKLNVLGLRHNRLSSIPSIISKLSNLTDLSLSSNKLQYLPPLILQLKNLHTFQAGPNPFVEIPPNNVTHLRFQLDDSRVLKCVSYVTYYNKRRSRIRSLRTSCLDCIAKYDVTYQETKSWKKSVPKMYHSLIAKAILNGKYDERCSECSTIIVEPLAGVVEWWNILRNKNVPIKRTFCCETCVEIWRKRIHSIKASN